MTTGRSTCSSSRSFSFPGDHVLNRLILLCVYGQLCPFNKRFLLSVFPLQSEYPGCSLQSVFRPRVAPFEFSISLYEYELAPYGCVGCECNMRLSESCFFVSWLLFWTPCCLSIAGTRYSFICFFCDGRKWSMLVNNPFGGCHVVGCH